MHHWHYELDGSCGWCTSNFNDGGRSSPSIVDIVSTTSIQTAAWLFKDPGFSQIYVARRSLCVVVSAAATAGRCCVKRTPREQSEKNHEEDAPSPYLLPGSISLEGRNTWCPQINLTYRAFSENSWSATTNVRRVSFSQEPYLHICCLPLTAQGRNEK